MSLESSHEHTEQERHQEEKDDSAATKREELQAQVIAWLQKPDWETSQTYLQRHPQLLTDAAQQMMEVLKRSQADPLRLTRPACPVEQSGCCAARALRTHRGPGRSGGDHHCLPASCPGNPPRCTQLAWPAKQSGRWAARPLRAHRGPGRSE